jgi:hypothetical protein
MYNYPPTQRSTTAATVHPVERSIYYGPVNRASKMFWRTSSSHIHKMNMRGSSSSKPPIGYYGNVFPAYIVRSLREHIPDATSVTNSNASDREKLRSMLENLPANAAPEVLQALEAILNKKPTDRP